MKTIDERETQKKQRQKRTREDSSYSERMRSKWFCCAFKLGFPELICKPSSIFMSNLVEFTIPIKNKKY